MRFQVPKAPYMSITFYSMIAVIEIGGKQYTVEAGNTIVVDRQHADVGATIELPALLVADADGKSVKVGNPTVEGSKVTLKVEDHGKGEKITVFKIKAKKRYMRTRGFRAAQTTLSVTSIA
jgi:large subunit ribosomal protein L21